MIDVSLLLRSFLCGVVGGRTSKSEKKSLFGEKSTSQITLFQTHHFSLRNSLSLSLSLSSFGQKTVCWFFVSSSFWVKKKIQKNRKRGGEFSLSKLSLSLSLSLLQHHHQHHHNRTLLLIQRKRGSKTTPQHQNNNNFNFNFNNNNSYW